MCEREYVDQHNSRLPSTSHHTREEREGAECLSISCVARTTHLPLDTWKRTSLLSLHVWRQRLQEWVVPSSHTQVWFFWLHGRSVCGEELWGVHALSCLWRLTDSFVALLLSFCLCLGARIEPSHPSVCSQACTEDSFTTKPSCWPLQSFSKAVIVYIVYIVKLGN